MSETLTQTTPWSMWKLLAAFAAAFCVHIISLPIPNTASLGTMLVERIVLICYVVYLIRVIVGAVRKERNREYWDYIMIFLVVIPYAAAFAVGSFDCLSR